MTNPGKEPISITHIPDLVTNLKGGHETSQANYLYSFAQDLLAKTGQEAAINGRPSIVTKYTCLIDGNDVEHVKTFHARVAKYDHVGSEPFIVFGETTDSRDITTKNPFALTFNSMGDHAVIRYAKGLEAIDNDEHQLELVGRILENIGNQYADSKHRFSRGLAKTIDFTKSITDDRLRKVRAFYTDKTPDTKYRERDFLIPETAGDRRILRTIGGGAVVLALYGHMIPSVFDGNLGDARLLGLPLPQPIELIVDWNNHVDHTAQGFDEPEGATPLSVGHSIDTIPLLTDYVTVDVPSTSYASPLDSGFTDESRPGLYETSFDASVAMEDVLYVGGTTINRKATAFDDNGCLPIIGDFTEGESSVFTQTADLDEKIQLRVVDTEELEVCLKDPNDTEAKGSIFIWQDEN